MLKKRLITIPLTLVIASAMAGLSAGQASAAEEKTVETALSTEEHGYGYIPVDIDVYDVPQKKGTDLFKLGVERLPSQYRSDKEVWAQNIKVRDQKKTALCWAFSACTASEYSYAKEYYEETGEILDLETSPGHLAQNFYCRENDPLGNTAGDYNGIKEHWALLGGHMIYGMFHMATWSGLVSEETAPFSETNDRVTKDNKWEGETTVYPAEIAYDHNAIVLQESILNFQIERVKMKQLIMKYGAISASMEFSNKYMNLDEIDPETGEEYDSGRSFYNYNDSFSANHGITIVGWDDDYPKENFAHDIAPTKDSKGNEVVISHEEAIEKTTPKNNGAWIIQNSWGDEVHEGGFFYASYETIDFRSGDRKYFVFDMQSPDAYKYNFFYDGSAGLYDTSDKGEDGENFPFRTMPGTKAANVFTNTTGEPVSIGAVGFATFNNGLSYYDVTVYTDLKDPDDPCSGIDQGTTRISTVYAGCKTAELNSEVTVLPGETFSVVFSFDEFNSFAIEKDYDLGYMLIEAETEPGQSYFCGENSEEWIDLNEYEVCYRIKALANTAKDVTKAPSAEELIYNGEDQKLVSGAEAVDLTVVYALGDNETEAPETGYSAEIPTGKDAGTYYVWYRVEEDGTAVSKARCVVAAIAGKPVSITAKDQTVSVNGKIRQGAGMVDVSGILEGHRLMKVKLVSSGTAAVTSEGIIIPSDAVILAREGNVTGNYDITYEPGVLTVKKAQSKPSYDDPTEKGDEDEKEDQDDQDEEEEDKDDTPDKETDPDKPEEVRYFAEWVNGKWYNKDGTQTYRPKAVWKRNEKGSYYIDDAGWYPRSRWQKIDGIWYYFNAEGYVVQGEYVQGWWLDRVSGRWTYPYRATWHKNNRGWWYGDSTGWYAKNRTYIIDGKVYKFDADGYLIEN